MLKIRFRLKKIILFSLLITYFASFSQEAKKIKIIYAGVSTIDEEKYPGATILTKDADRLVEIYHDGAILTAKRVILYKKRNFAKAFGDVLIKQGDTITQSSNYVDYDGNTKKALSWGNVVLKDPKMTLTTDSLNFDRQNQLFIL